MFYIFLTLVLAILPGTLGETLHEKMSPEEVMEIFQTTHNSVPDYQVVQFHIPQVKKRDLREAELLKVNAFGNDVELWVQPTDGVLAGKNTPVFIAQTDNNTKNVVYTEIPQAMEVVGRILEDPYMKATMIGKKDSRGLRSFNGYIGSMNLVVRSLPESISNELMQNRSSHDSASSMKSRKTRSAYHVVFKREEKRLDQLAKSIGVGNPLSSSLKPTPMNNLYTIPDVLYPEIMVVMDYNLFNTTGSSINGALIYILAFWNGVDLLYRSFDEPKLRFNIARVIIAQDDEATPFISKNMYNDMLLNAFIGHSKAQEYYFSILNIFPFHTYDAVMVMTSLMMTSGSGKPDVLGIATSAGACSINYRQAFVGSVGFLTDDGTFHGVATAAHEFAHLLGAPHDDRHGCMPLDGYIMAPASGVTENSHDFSECTIRRIEYFLRQHRGICFYNKPKVSDPLPRGLLPGLLSDRDHQCRMMNKGRNCYMEFPNQLPCSAVYCEDPGNSTLCYQYKSQAPPDGAYCSEGKICLHGKCIQL